jgi:DNA-binding LacI/PurR family transcriptional regulator
MPSVVRAQRALRLSSNPTTAPRGTICMGRMLDITKTREKSRPRLPGKATSFDIAYRAGVSQPTVSRALRGSPMVSEETRTRILAIARDLNYKVDKNASNLRFQHSNTLAVLFFEDPTPDGSLINPFFLSMLGSITRACAERGYDLLISFQRQYGDEPADFAVSRKADGIILLGYGDYHEARTRLERLVKQGTRFVRWGQVLPGQPGLSVGCDNFQGARDATRHLLALGRRRIAFLGDASSHYPEFQERFRGYTDALAQAGMPVRAPLQHDAITTEHSGYAAAARLLEGREPFDAILGASDLIAIGAMHALLENGIDVPGGVSVVGFDDIPAATLAHPSLTTVMQDTRLAGDVLVASLLKLVRGEPASDQLLPARLVVRRSCGASCAPPGAGDHCAL